MEMIAYAIAMMIVSTIVTAALMPRPKDSEAASFESFEFPQAEEGTAQAVTFGDCWSKDWAVIGLGNSRTEPITKSSDSGK